MKRLTQLIKESVVDFDSVEDVMIHFEDMGFKIEAFNDLGRIRDQKGPLFGPGNFESTYYKMNSYSYAPSKVACYPVFIISLKRNFFPFSDCDLYAKVINEAETVKRRLNTCQVYYRLDITSIQGSTMDSGLYGDIEKSLQITFHITDKSTKISEKSISERNDIKKWLESVVKIHKITNIYSIIWGTDDISINISTNYGYEKEINDALVSLEMQENLDKVASGWKIKKTIEDYQFLGNPANNIIVTYSPK